MNLQSNPRQAVCDRIKLSLFVLCLFATVQNRLFAASTTVTMSNFAFVPSTVTVNVGDTVVWINETGTHTVTGVGSDLFCGTAPVPVSCSVTFLQAGTFPYVCQIHESQGMVGTVNVVSTNTSAHVQITYPKSGDTLKTSGSVEITVTNVSEASFSQVEFFDNERSIGVVTNSPFTLSTTLDLGDHTLTAKATEEDGSTTTSEAVTVTVPFEISNPLPKPIARSMTVIELERVMDGLISPVGMAALEDGSGRLLVYDQVGLVHVIQNGAPLPSPFLDVRARLVNLNTGYDERGLLGVAAHPQFAENPKIYTYTSEPNGAAADYPVILSGGQSNNHQSVIAEWQVDPGNTNRILVASRRELLRFDQPQANHNGGTLRFGRDGYLYIATGDGGGADDQGPGHVAGGNAQNKTNILGKVLRIDVQARTSANGQYGVPTDNPFTQEPGAAPEIYAYGFRNPYTFSFDRGTGELWLADVGQNQIEEIDRVTKAGNFGWPFKEGSFFFNPNGTNSGYLTETPPAGLPPNLVDPYVQYDHDEGEAVIGGFIYRGSEVSALQGAYVMGDFGRSGENRGRLLVAEGGELRELRIGMQPRSLGLFLKGFGEDAAGELYVLGSTNAGPTGASGQVLKVVRPFGSTLAFVAVELNEAGLKLGWAGGVPPYTVQKKNTLSDAQWVDVTTTSDSQLVVPIAGKSGFFRILDQGVPAPTR